MVDILREKKRQYIADKTEAIKIGQQAQFWGDVSKVVGAVSSITGSMATIENNRERAAQKQAQSDLSAHENEAKAIIEDLRNKYGESITSDKGQQAVRDALGKHFRNYRPQYDNDRTGSAYDMGADKYVIDVIDQNYLYATRTKINRQNAERAAAEKRQQMSMKNQSAYNDLGQELIAQAGNLGSYGAHKDVDTLGSDVDGNIDEILKKIPGTSAQKMEAKAGLYNAAMQSQAVGALTSSDPAVAEQMNLALNNQEVFDKTFSDTLIQPQIENVKNNVVKKLTDEKNSLETELMVSAGKNKKEIENKIKKLDKQISNLVEKDEFEGKNFSSAIRENLRVGIKESTKNRAQHALGERELENRLEVFEQQKQFVADGVLDPYNPTMEKVLDFMSGKLKNVPFFERIRWVAQKIKDAEPTEKHLATYKPEQWQEMADSYRSYKDHMSKVSQFTESFYTTKADVNAGLFELMSAYPTDDKGDPTEFEMKAIKFLDKMASADLTEQERISYRDYVGGLLLSDNATVQKQKELLTSGNVGVFAIGGAFGIINYPAADLPLDDERQGGGISGARRLYDERAKRGIQPESTENGRAYYANRDFDKYLNRAQAEYVTEAITMLRNGATEEDVLLMKDKKIRKAVDDYYQNYHVVNMSALRSKLEKHQPAFQNIDGVVYEYKGDDSNGIPIWYDHGVLNTNRDFHQLFEPKRMAGSVTSGFGNKIKRSDIASDMEGANE